jgi:hypothetical protein
VSALRCHGCGTPLVRRSSYGRAPKWCSSRCRKRTLYGGTCKECGAGTVGDSGPGSAPDLCGHCSASATGRANKRWTRDALLAKLREWAAIYGEPPAVPDWDPWNARFQKHDDARAARFEEGGWPHASTVIYEFGTWNAALVAAGFAPRMAHGGAGNERRKRSVRRRAAA